MSSDDFADAGTYTARMFPNIIKTSTDFLNRFDPIDFKAFEPFKPVYKLARYGYRKYGINDQRGSHLSFTCGYSEALRRFAAFKVQKRLEGQDNPIFTATIAQGRNAMISLFMGAQPLVPMASGVIKVTGC